MERILDRPEHKVFAKLDGLLAKAVRCSNADKGTLQIYNRHKDGLDIISQKGFDPSFLEHFKDVKAFDSSACGRAFGTGNVVQINDVSSDIGFQYHRSIALAAGFRAVRSVPLYKFRHRKPVGVLSVHYGGSIKTLDSGKIDAVATEIADELYNILLQRYE